MEVDDAIDVKPPFLQRKTSAKKSASVKRRIVDDDDNSMSEDDLVKREDEAKPVKIEDEGLGKSLKSIDMSDVFSADGSDNEQIPKDEDEKPAIKPKRLTKLLPDATAEARKVFKEIPDSIYAAKNLGMNPFRDDANMVCECTYDPATSPREDACGEDCVNRQIFMECTPGECRCGAYCLNRRFQRKEYADVQVIKTENKGYGLQTRQTLSKGDFIYEYIGEVIDEPTFVERMQKYSDEGIKHFYFMMLQAGEFIDATVKGGLGRFVNHSCNPNCEVGKWVVGKHFRMGIFSKRKIQRGEELTFNYNVDRYGADAQKCYCGEPNCSGYIGGSTQTQLDTLPEMGLEALGFDATSMASARRKKPKKGDVVLPDPTPMRDDRDVARVVTAIRSFKDEREIIKRLLARIRMTEAANLQRQVMRLHGFSVLAVILQDLKDDAEIVSAALDVLLNLPLLKRNKIEDSKIETPIRDLQEKCEHEEIRNMSKTLLEHWQTLEMSYRIPKKQIALEAQGIEVEKENPKKRSPEEPSNGKQSPEKRAKVSPSTPVSNGARHDRAPASEDRATWSGWRRPSRSPPRRPPPRRSPPRQMQPNSPSVEDNSLTKEKMQKIIEEAQRKAAEAQAAKEAAEREEREAKEKEEKAREAFKKQKLKAKLSKSSLKSDEKSESQPTKSKSQSQSQSQSKPKALTDEEREKKLTKLVSDVVIKSMSHFKDQMEKEQFKKRAKELTHILVAKEQKSQSNSTKVADFSDDKKAKMKKFIKEYMNKLIKRIKEKQAKSNGKGGSPVTPDTPMKEAVTGSESMDVAETE